ncbi:MAG: MopE-related protein, partial [Myxococcota bacterium]
DIDYDFYGDPANVILRCDRPKFYRANGLDCDDLDASSNPAAAEVCDGADNDCDAEIDEGLATQTYYADADGDGYGDPTITQVDCAAPSGHVSDNTDCDDTVSVANPGQTEVCDAVDNDCDTEIDEGVTVTRYPDTDGDGYGAPSAPTAACPTDAGYVDDSSDCDDSAAAVFPGASETCNDDIDSDCDGRDSNVCDQDLGAADATLVGGVDDRAGFSVSTAGDVNQDGFADVIVGARFAGSGQPGAAYLIFGPATGSMSLSAADAVFTGEAAGDQAGVSVSGGGDLDGDGYDDLIIGAQMNDRGATDAGATYVFYGPISGNISLSAADADFVGADTDGRSGRAVRLIEDLNSDGRDELLIGAAQAGGADGISFNRGEAYLFYGAPTSASTDDADQLMQGEDAHDFAGYAIADAGDVDGDGRNDLLVNAYRADPVSFNEGSTYLVTDVTAAANLATATARFDGISPSDQAGEYAVDGAGDTNNDGYDDIIIGAMRANSKAGRIYVFFGPQSGSASLSAADAILTGTSGSFAGRSVASAGDVDADGHSDIIIGAKRGDEGGTASGSAYLFRGPLSGTLGLSTADAIFTGHTPGDEAGISVDSAGDVDGDGYDDLIIGAHLADGGGFWAGEAYLIFGGGY